MKDIAIHLFLTCTIILSVLNAPLSASAQKEIAHEKMQNIPSADLKVLEGFFRELLFFQGFAYTLFGDKPVSTECFDLDNPEKPDMFATSCKGYKTWGKYAHLFPQEHYVFLFYEDADEYQCEMTLINKKAFLQIVDKHREKFAEVFGSEITPEKLLSLIVQKRCLWNTPMKDRDDLIGILLGYGKNNAELFQKREELKKERTKPSASYCSMDEELEALNNRLQSFSGEGKITLNYMRFPGFAADHHHRETVQLKKKYAEQRKRITTHYFRKNVLEATLSNCTLQQKPKTLPHNRNHAEALKAVSAAKVGEAIARCRRHSTWSALRCITRAMF